MEGFRWDRLKKLGIGIGVAALIGLLSWGVGRLYVLLGWESNGVLASVFGGLSILIVAFVIFIILDLVAWLWGWE